MTTNAEGNFTCYWNTELVRSTCFIEAPGFAFKMFHMPVPVPARSIVIPVDQSGGTIVVKRLSSTAILQTRQPILVHQAPRVHSFRSRVDSRRSDARGKFAFARGDD